MHRNEITPGSTVEHVESGKKYVVICVTNEDCHNKKKWPTAVVYMDDFGSHYHRPINDFLMRFTIQPVGRAG